MSLTTPLAWVQMGLQFLQLQVAVPMNLLVHQVLTGVVFVGPNDQHRPAKVVQPVMHHRLAGGVLCLHIVQRYVICPAEQVGAVVDASQANMEPASMAKRDK